MPEVKVDPEILPRAIRVWEAYQRSTKSKATKKIIGDNTVGAGLRRLWRIEDLPGLFICCSRVPKDVQSVKASYKREPWPGIPNPYRNKLSWGLFVRVPEIEAALGLPIQ